MQGLCTQYAKASASSSDRYQCLALRIGSAESEYRGLLPNFILRDRYQCLPFGIVVLMQGLSIPYAKASASSSAIAVARSNSASAIARCTRLAILIYPEG